MTYIKSVNPNLYATDGKKRFEKNLELFVRELHGKGNCPHLLTLNNIYQIAAYSIEQVSHFLTVASRFEISRFHKSNSTALEHANVLLSRAIFDKKAILNFSKIFNHFGTRSEISYWAVDDVTVNDFL